MFREEFKLHKLNANLNKIYNELKNKARPNLNDISSVDSKRYHIRVELRELIHNPRLNVEYKNESNTPPQQTFLSNLFRDRHDRNDITTTLGELISPCINKRLWFHKNNLITYRILKINVKLDSLEMTDILKNCPHPKTCLDPKRYVIKNNPELFVKTINDLRKEDDVFNYVFNFWRYIPIYIVNNDAVYKLNCDIHQIDDECIDDGDVAQRKRATKKRRVSV